jgi:hypothetical protein
MPFNLLVTGDRLAAAGDGVGKFGRLWQVRDRARRGAEGSGVAAGRVDRVEIPDYWSCNDPHTY